MTESELIEQLAAAEHASWGRWMEHLFSKCWKDGNGCMVIPESWVDRWQRQIETPYADLPEREKQSDRNEVEHTLPIIFEYFRKPFVVAGLAAAQRFKASIEALQTQAGKSEQEIEP